MTELGLARDWRHRLTLGNASLISTIGETLAAERERWALWIPAALGLGIGIYFAASEEPPLWLGVVLVSAATAALLCFQAAKPILFSAFLISALVAGGFTLAQIETWRMAGAGLDRPLGIVAVDGIVEDWEILPEGAKLVLNPTRIQGVAAMPRLIRVSLRRNPDSLAVGDQIHLKASLMPPPGPALPGGFDYQRQAYFSGIGAVGYAVGDVQIEPAPVQGGAGWVRALRLSLAARIRGDLPGASGAVAAALITGERGAIPEVTNDAYRNAGLAHLLVIAGLHMTLVTGFVFFAFRALLALVPAIALRYPIKKWAATCALVVAAIYLVLSGASVPTQRAFVMVSIALVAVLMDRWSVSMRAVAMAATLILVIDPAALTGVSFQMSFAAVVGLVAFYESYGSTFSSRHLEAGLPRRVLAHAAGVVLTTLIATLSTAAFSIYHFNRFAVFSVVANVIAVPLAGVWVLPLAFIACLLLPLGAERLALVPLGWGLDLIGAVARWTADLPGATIDLPTMPFWGFLAAALGGLWLALWRKGWRRWGVVPILVGICSFVTLKSPDILVSESDATVAVKLAGGYVFSSDHAGRQDRESWLRVTGSSPLGVFPGPGESSFGLRCDPESCLWPRPDGIIAFVRTRAALEEDCRNAILVVSAVPVPRFCRSQTRVIDSTDIRRGGATAVWLEPSIVIARANAERGNRPWVRKDPFGGGMQGK